MSNIINKSNHPVEVKKIPVRMWKLRDEIEDAIARRIESEGHSDDKPVDIEDIKLYYTSILNAEKNDSEDDDDDDDDIDPNVDSSGNPMDDDALEMMAALGGGEEKTEEDEESTNEEEEPKESESDDAGEQDDEAAMLAAQMLADQGMGITPPSENEDDDDEAAMLAAQMLADQAPSAPPAEEKEERKPFKRSAPSEAKVVNGFVLLSDINMDHIVIFSQGTFIHGQNVVIEFVVPKAFTQMVEVVSSIDISRKSKIISATKPGFRVRSTFLFKFDGERGELRSFLQSIEPEIPEPPKKLKRPESDDDDDDFDDLGF